MNEETQNSEASESNEAPAGRTLSEDRYPVEDPGPGKPRFEPSEGTRHVYDSAKKMWMVERDPSYKEGEEPSPERGEHKSPTPDAKPGTADESGGLTLGEHLPPAIREDPGAATVLREASEALDHVQMEPAAKQRLVDLAVDLHAADLEAGIPPLWNEEAIHGVLRQRWGAAYPERLARAQAAAKALGPAFLQWCGTDYRGNSPALLETLALMADKEKLLGLSPADAAAKMKAWRSDPKHPLRNSLHPEHAVSLAKARVLAILSERKGRRGNVEELVQDRQEAKRQEKDGGLDPATDKIDSELRQLRLDPAYFDKSKPNHKVVIERVRELYRQRYPD